MNSSLPVTAAGLGRECQLPGSCARWFLRTNFTGTLRSGVGFPGGSGGKESACSAGDLGSIPGFGRSPGEGNSHPTQVFWPGGFHGVAKSRKQLSDFLFPFPLSALDTSVASKLTYLWPLLPLTQPTHSLLEFSDVCVLVNPCSNSSCLLEEAGASY